MFKHLDLETWSRRRHFEFFRNSDDPFFNLCTEVDVTRLVEKVSSLTHGSFFLASLWISTRAANETESFRYRLEGDSILVFDSVDCGSTILREDETFGFGYFRYTTDYSQFASEGAREIARVRSETGDLRERTDSLAMIYYSVIPWVSFSSFSHARNRGERDSIPRIVFGRHHPDHGRRMMPISVEVHHALMDGLHVARYLERMQDYLNDAESLASIR